MSLIVPWIVFPLVLALLSTGAGLLAEEAAGRSLRPGLRLPVGLAVIVVAGLFTTADGATAQLTVPLVVALAAAGWALAVGRRPRIRPAVAPAAAALGTFAAYGAPVIATGSATFTGYVKLDDTATFLGFTDEIMSHGRDLAGPASSTYQIMLQLNIGEGYPVGTYIPLGVGEKLTGQDGLWLYQPCMAFYAAAASLALYALLEGLIRSRALRAGVAFIAAQAALIYAYALWGGMKEVAATAMIALTAALVPVRRKELASPRAQIPFALAAAATLGVLSVTGIIWVGLLSIPALVLVTRAPGRAWKAAVGALAAVALLAIPSLAIASEFIHYTSSNLLTHAERYGNLIRALPLDEMLGIWPGGDFRVDPTHYTVTRILIVVAGAAALGGAAWGIWRRRIRLPLVGATVVVAAVFLDLDTSPWLTAKALATASPFLVALALAGAAALVQLGYAIPGTVVGVVLAAAVVYSNVLGYRAVWLAPRGQLVELEQIGHAFAGEGPALMTEYQPYGVRHLLRDLDAEGASELRVHAVPLADGSEVAPGGYADIDQFRYPDLLYYRTLILRRSPVESRPGAPYQLVFQGRYYEVWQRPVTGYSTVLEHVPLGDASAPSAVPSCSVVRSVAAVAAASHGTVAAATTPNPIFVPLAAGALPPGWIGSASDPDYVTPSGSATLLAKVEVPRAGSYDVSLDGAYGIWRHVSVAIDGSHVGTVDESGSLYAPLGSVHLTAGTHYVTLTDGNASLAPGAAAPIYQLGPLALSPAGLPAPVEYVAPARATSLCGKSLDWLEAVSP
jgi:hypothetical protein